VAHLVAPRIEGEDQSKDIDFSTAGISARRKAGYADTLRMIERSPWQEECDPIEGVIEHV
jgi:NTE family protein